MIAWIVETQSGIPVGWNEFEACLKLPSQEKSTSKAKKTIGRLSFTQNDA
jgi:hypothetical protein